MAKSSSKGPPRVLPPEGIHPGRCFGVIEMGTIEQKNSKYAPTPQIKLRFEVIGTSHVFKEGEAAQPFAITRNYSMTVGRGSNLRKLIESWFGKTVESLSDKNGDFDYDFLLNKTCKLNISHMKGKEGKDDYADFTITPWPEEKGKVAAAKNKLIAFSIDAPGKMVGKNAEGKAAIMPFDWMETFKCLHESYQKEIEKTPEFIAAAKKHGGYTSETVEDNADDLPDDNLGEDVPY